MQSHELTDSEKAEIEKRYNEIKDAIARGDGQSVSRAIKNGTQEQKDADFDYVILRLRAFIKKEEKKNRDNNFNLAVLSLYMQELTTLHPASEDKPFLTELTHRVLDCAKHPNNADNFEKLNLLATECARRDKSKLARAIGCGLLAAVCLVAMGMAIAASAGIAIPIIVMIASFLKVSVEIAIPIFGVLSLAGTYYSEQYFTDSKPKYYELGNKALLFKKPQATKATSGKSLSDESELVFDHDPNALNDVRDNMHRPLGVV